MEMLDFAVERDHLKSESFDLQPFVCGFIEHKVKARRRTAE